MNGSASTRGRLLVLGAASLALVALAPLSRGPFAFLPPTVRWPLLLLAAGAPWRPLLERHSEQLSRLFARKGLWEGLGLAAVFVTYLLLAVVAIRPTATDENVYFYLAKRVSEGAVPYRDFFFAHPPVHLLVPALVFRLLGFSIPVAKSIPILAEAAAGVFLYLSLRRLDRWLAWLALLLYLTAYQVLMGASAMDGENLATAFLLAALFALTRRHFAVAGALAGLSMGTVLYTAPGVIALAAATAVLRRTGPLRFALGFLATFGLLAALFGALGGGGFWTGVVGYHLAKTPGADHVPLFGSLNPIHVAGAFLHDATSFLGGKTFGRSLFFHLPLYVAAVIGTAFAVVGRLRDARHALVIPCAATVLAFLALWSALSEVYDFYTVPMVAFLAVPAASGLLVLGRALRPDAPTRALVACAGAAAAFCLHVPLASSLERALWPEEAARAGETVRFEWRAPSALRPLALLSRGLFFAEARVRGEPQPPYRHFQWNKMLEFSTSEAIASYVRASSSPDETLTGASAYAPLVALLADRRMAADEADTNAKRFKTGLLTTRAFYERVCRDRLRFIVSAPRSPFGLQALAASPTASWYFERAQTFEEGKLRHAGVERLAVLRRRDDVAPARPGMVCAALDPVGGADGVLR